MSVNVRGTAFFMGQAVKATDASFENYYHWLRETSKNNASWPFFDDRTRSYTHGLYCNANTTHFYGLFVSAKDEDYQYLVKREGQKVTIIAEQIEEPSVDINFFCIRLDSNKGLYSHYRGSYPFNSFLHDIKSVYSKYVKKLRTIEEERGQLRKKDISELYKFSNDASPLFLKNEFNALLESLESINKISFTTYECNDPADKPLLPVINSVHKEYRLNLCRKDITSDVLARLFGMRTSSKRKMSKGKIGYTGKIYGTENDGEPISIDFSNTLKDYLSFDHSEIGSFDLDNLHQHEIIKSMINQMSNSNTDLFEASKE